MSQHGFGETPSLAAAAVANQCICCNTNMPLLIAKVYAAPAQTIHLLGGCLLKLRLCEYMHTARVPQACCMANRLASKQASTGEEVGQIANCGKRGCCQHGVLTRQRPRSEVVTFAFQDMSSIIRIP